MIVDRDPLISDWLAAVVARVLDALDRRPDLDTGGLVGVLAADYPRAAELRTGASPTEAVAAALDGVLAKAPEDDRVAGLVRVLDLQADEAMLLLAAVAPELDANLGAALALLTGATSGAWLTVRAGLELAGVPTAAARVAALLGPSATLLRHGLLDVTGDGPRLHRQLRPAARLVAHVSGDDAPDPAVARARVRVVPVDADEIDEVARALKAGAPLVWLRAPVTSARLEVAAAVYAQFGVAALTVDLGRAPAAQAWTVARAAVREAVLSGCALVVAGIDDLARQPVADGPNPGHDARAVIELLMDAVVPVLAVGDTPWQPGWAPDRPLTVEIGRTSTAQVRRLWSEQLADMRGPELESLAAVRLPPHGIVEAAQHARLLATSRGRALDAAVVRESARLVAAGGGAAGRVAPPNGDRVSFDDLVLGDAALADLRRMVGWVRVRHEVVAAGPVHGRAGKGTGIAALFTGGPGTGKTLAAHVVADELGLDLFQVDLTSIVDKYIGETEKNLERVFAEAESRDVVLFFDEADSLFGRRSEVRDARDRYANQEVSYLLQRLEHFDGLTVLATNLRGNLDQAFTRRMQFLVHFPDPEEPTRARLWTHHLSSVAALDEQDPPDVQYLAKVLEVSGGDIRNVVLGAAYDAATERVPVGMRHLVLAARRELTKLARQVPAALAART